jgi:uncharacterized protein YrrD
MEMRRPTGPRVEPITSRRAEAPIKRLSQLRGMPVVDISSAHRIGTVVNVHIDPNAGSVESIDVGRNGDATEHRVKVVDIRRIGKDAVVMLPAAANGHHRQEALDGFIDTATITGLEVLDEEGDRVGFISDILLNADSLEVQSYELTTPFLERLFRGPRRIVPDRVLMCSRDVMLIRSSRPPVVITVKPEAQEQTTAWRGRPLRLATSTVSEDTEIDQTAAVRPA